MLLATQSKFRPIVMTSIASVAGMLPMALGTGLGSELRSSCGMGVVGGLSIASLLTLYVIPALYFIFVHDTAKPRRHTGIFHFPFLSVLLKKQIFSGKSFDNATLRYYM